MAKFEKGHKKKGGREKGIENKITQDARELFISIMEGEVCHVQKALADVRNEECNVGRAVCNELSKCLMCLCD